MLKLSLVNQLRTTYKRCLAGQSLQVQLSPTEAEPAYPEIRDPSFKARKQKDAADWHEEIRQVPTVEEKMIKINMPRYYGYKVVDFNDSKIPYNALPLTQHYTRTVVEDLELPSPSASASTSPEVADQGDKSTSSEDALVKATREDVIEALEFAHDYYKHLEKLPNSAQPSDVERERILTQIIVEQLNRTLLQALGEEYKHLEEVEVDYNPRHEAFWAVGGVDPPKNVQNSKKGREWQKDEANESIDRLVQYTGTPYLSLRHRKQLSPWKTPAESEDLQLSKQLPRFKHDPRTLGYSTKHQHATNVPGYWPKGNEHNFGLLSFQSRAHLQLRPKSYGEQDLQEALHALAIKSSYAWLLAQANYNGFNTYNELTYPMNTQTVITNGREWSFYEYQLNTLLLHGKHQEENPRVNFCRGTKPLPLYAEISSSGKCVDFNDTTLRQLLNFYANVPSIQRSIGEQQPYVASDITAYENVEQRDFITKTFKHLASNRPRHLELPEIYLWEKLYKIDNNNRAMEPKRRFFELDVNPWQRPLDQHDKEYVPRALRPGVRKNQNRFKKTYYP
ncbi:39S ribosomal protein S30, mitochondrial [Drosophila subpulchrella]|uniref:39S ribosomal protein S30, mitochondrial n=1 Tax=Drosophila subpulchrella TaxID=1486046 RepID=UPI0018A17805|nr:39S ribosomal protein S30, mitochondrial [Drosophila subpulchrella]